MSEKTKTPQKWLMVTVYRAADGIDCSRAGVTSRVSVLFVPHDQGNLDTPDEELQLLPRTRGGVGNFVPALIVARGKYGDYATSGGNFVWSCDSRFRELYGDRPVAVHDRAESASERLGLGVRAL